MVEGKQEVLPPDDELFQKAANLASFLDEEGGVIEEDRGEAGKLALEFWNFAIDLARDERKPDELMIDAVTRRIERTIVEETEEQERGSFLLEVDWYNIFEDLVPEEVRKREE